MSGEGGSIRILVVDDHFLVREGIGRVQWEFPALVSQVRKFAGLLVSVRV